MKATDITSLLRSPLCSALAVGIVLGALCIGTVSPAQANQQLNAGLDLARRFIDASYSVAGPLSVVQITPDSLTLRNPYKDTVLSLRGQNLAVMDENAQPLAESDIATGSTVYVCRKGEQMAVIVLPK